MNVWSRSWGFRIVLKTEKINQYEMERFSELFVQRNLWKSCVDRIVNVSLFEHQLLRQFSEAQHIIGEITGPCFFVG